MVSLIKDGKPVKALSFVLQNHHEKVGHQLEGKVHLALKKLSET